MECLCVTWDGNVHVTGDGDSGREVGEIARYDTLSVLINIFHLTHTVISQLVTY